MDQKMFTRGEKQGELAHEVKSMEFDFGGNYPQYDVCEELGINPKLLSEAPAVLRQQLIG